MDEPLLKSGQFPNVAIMAGTDPAEVMREHGQVIPDGEKYELADSREQLEADAMCDAKMLWNSADECIIVIRGWLDRQAAITERECMSRDTSERVGWDCAECAEGLGKELDARCDPLKERIAELTAEVEKHRQRANDAERGVLSDEWYVARDRYEDDIAELTSERDHFRKHVNHLMALIADIARKQPYTFDPEAPYMTLDTIGDYLDELHGDVASMRAERDELQAKVDELTAERNEFADELKLDAIALDELRKQVDELTAERDQLSRDLEAEHALVVQFEHDNEELRHANNTLRASVAGLKMTVEKLGARNEQLL